MDTEDMGGTLDPVTVVTVVGLDLTDPTDPQQLLQLKPHRLHKPYRPCKPYRPHKPHKPHKQLLLPSRYLSYLNACSKPAYCNLRKNIIVNLIGSNSSRSCPTATSHFCSSSRTGIFKYNPLIYLSVFILFFAYNMNPTGCPSGCVLHFPLRRVRIELLRRVSFLQFGFPIVRIAKQFGCNSTGGH